MSLGHTLDSYAGFYQTLCTVILTNTWRHQKRRSAPFAPACCHCCQTAGTLLTCWPQSSVLPLHALLSLLLRLGLPACLGHSASVLFWFSWLYHLSMCCCCCCFLFLIFRSSFHSSNIYLLLLCASRTRLPMQKTRDAGSIPGSGRSPGGGNGNPPQYSCLGNPLDRGAWRATVHGVDTTEPVSMGLLR